MTPGLSGLLGIHKDDRIAVVGCGGKTTLINQMANQNANAPVLVMPTTQIRPMQGDGITLAATLEACLTLNRSPGICCAGILNTQTGKLKSPPPEYWSRITEGFPLVLMEADGSAGRFCKGWAAHEPVIPAFTTKTIGVIPISAIGLPANEQNVWRMPEFCRLTNLNPGEIISLQAVAAMAAAPGGMFKNATGQRYLYINRLHQKDDLKKATHLVQFIRQHYPHTIDYFVGTGGTPDNLTHFFQL